MTIAALPEDTVRLLGSHTVITTPVDLVKELLDNAIDAKATSVDILVSPNIVDKIEVRDNGQGIHPDDYASLGRAGHTSKITSFEDTLTLGGTTLGFRGQALASANNIGAVAVTTRTAEDSAAVKIVLSPGLGGVESHRPTSAPFGTTVSLVGLYSRLPVRKQAAIREASKNLTKIKQLLQAYALARPHIRLSLRILGGSSKQAFSYSPRPVAGIKEAVLQIFGTELASQCLVRTICSGADIENDEPTEHGEKFSIEAVLPKPNADQSSIVKGPFFSIDSRPVSAQRETMKKLLTMFKTQYLASLQTAYGEKIFKSPFICVNIRCSPGSYDPNIEPSKNVVLFADESQVTHLFERLCEDVYRRPVTHDPYITVSKRQLLQGARIRTPPISSDSQGQDEPTTLFPNELTQDLVVQSQQTPLPSSSSPLRQILRRTVPPRRLAPAKLTGRGFTVDMSADPDISSDEEAEVIAQRRRQQSGLQAVEENEAPMEALNPWIIAKMNAPARQTVNIQPLPVEQLHYDAQVQESPALAIPDEAFEDLPVLRPFGDAPADLDALRTTRFDIIPAGYPRLELPGFQHPLTHGTIKNPTSHDGPQPPLQTIEVNNRHSLPILRHSADRPPAGKFPDEGVEEAVIDGLVQARLASGGHPGASQTARKGRAQRHINTISSKTNPPYRKPKRADAKNRRPSISNQGHSDDHVATWVENHRLTGHRPVSMRPQGTPQISAPPRSGSGNTDISITQDRLPSTMSPAKENWVDGDSRKYLMKRQRSEAEHIRRGRQPLKRVKTDRLPLETVPQRQGIQHLLLGVEIDAIKLEKTLGDVAGADDFHVACRTDIELMEEMDLDTVVELEVRLRDLLSSWIEKIIGERIEVNLNLRSKVKGKMLSV